VLRLQLASHEEIEPLVDAAYLQVGSHLDGIKSLQGRVQDLMEPDRAACLQPGAESFLGDQLVDGNPQLHQLGKGHAIEPMAVVDHLDAVHIKNTPDLGEKRGGVVRHLLPGQWRPGSITPGWVANLRGEAAHQENQLMPLVLESAPFDPRSAVQNAVDTVRPLAESKGLALRAEHTDLPDTWYGDRRRMEQILLNLLNNAIKFTDEGEVGIRAAALPEDPGMRITVSDSGVGISAENMAKIFKPFQQIDSGLSRQHEGTGLGLDICRRLVTLMGGEIEVQSSPGEGSSFTLVLPATQGIAANGTRHPADRG